MCPSTLILTLRISVILQSCWETWLWHICQLSTCTAGVAETKRWMKHQAVGFCEHARQRWCTGTRKWKHSTPQKASALTLKQGSVELKVQGWTHFLDFKVWWITEGFKKTEKGDFKHSWLKSWLRQHKRKEQTRMMGSSCGSATNTDKGL